MLSSISKKTCEKAIQISIFKGPIVAKNKAGVKIYLNLNHTLSHEQKMQIINLKLLLYLTDCQILFENNRVETVDNIHKLCKFHENLTTNTDCIV